MQSKNGFIQEFKRLQRDISERIRIIEEAVNSGKASSDDEDVINELNALKQSEFRIKEYQETLLTSEDNSWQEIVDDLQKEVKKAQQLLEQDKKSIKNR